MWCRRCRSTEYIGRDTVVAMDPRVRTRRLLVAAMERMLVMAERCVTSTRRGNVVVQEIG